MREFNTGATRDGDKDKYDFEGFLHPLVLERFAQYMHKHRIQADGELREADNWQKGMPRDAYIKSGFRHFMDWWSEHRGYASRDGLEDALCALLFNVQGYLHEVLLGRDVGKQEAPLLVTHGGDQPFVMCDPSPEFMQNPHYQKLFGRPFNPAPQYIGEEDYAQPAR